MAIQSIKRDGQNAKLLVHLAKGKPLTRLKAFHIYHVANLTARMSDISALEIPMGDAGNIQLCIDTNVKTDPNGASFAEYRIVCLTCRKHLGRYLSGLRRAAKRAA